MRNGGGDRISPGRLTIENQNVMHVIREAYNVKDFQISGAPAWAGEDNYDIVAKATYAASFGQMEVMLQSLLADRFQLKCHRVQAELKGCSLVVGKNGPKFHEYRELKDDDARKTGVLMGRGLLRGRKSDMEYLAIHISNALDVPVIDRTGLKGLYEISLEYFTDGKLPDDTDIRPESLPAAIETQLGLKLVAQKIPVELLVIDHMERPTEN